MELAINLLREAILEKWGAKGEDLDNLILPALNYYPIFIDNHALCVYTSLKWLGYHTWHIVISDWSINLTYQVLKIDNRLRVISSDRLRDSRDSIIIGYLDEPDFLEKFLVNIEDRVVFSANG